MARRTPVATPKRGRAVLRPVPDRQPRGRLRRHRAVSATWSTTRPATTTRRPGSWCSPRTCAAILDGTKKAEPLFIRVNAGDCINFSLTNMAPNWTGGDAFQQLTQTNMAGGHIHLVKFDVTASDGGSNGWNYQEAAFTPGAGRAHPQAGRRRGHLHARAPRFYGGEQHRLPHRRPDVSWTPPADSAGLWGQTIHERWFADYELRTVFTHDHHFAALVQNHGQFGALIVEPQGFDVRDPATGAFLQPINDPRQRHAVRHPLRRHRRRRAGRRRRSRAPTTTTASTAWRSPTSSRWCKRGGDPRNPARRRQRPRPRPSTTRTTTPAPSPSTTATPR